MLQQAVLMHTACTATLSRIHNVLHTRYSCPASGKLQRSTVERAFANIAAAEQQLATAVSTHYHSRAAASDSSHA